MEKLSRTLVFTPASWVQNPFLPKKIPGFAHCQDVAIPSPIRTCHVRVSSLQNCVAAAAPETRKGFCHDAPCYGGNAVAIRHPPTCEVHPCQALWRNAPRYIARMQLFKAGSGQPPAPNWPNSSLQARAQTTSGGCKQYARGGTKHTRPEIRGPMRVLCWVGPHEGASQ